MMLEIGASESLAHPKVIVASKYKLMAKSQKLIFIFEYENGTSVMACSGGS